MNNDYTKENIDVKWAREWETHGLPADKAMAFLRFAQAMFESSGAVNSETQGTSCKRCNAYATLVKSLETQRTHLQKEVTASREAVKTLASEREANARLTEELEVLLSTVKIEVLGIASKSVIDAPYKSGNQAKAWVEGWSAARNEMVNAQVLGKAIPDGYVLMPKTLDDALWRAGCAAFRAALNKMTGQDGYVVKQTYEALHAHLSKQGVV